jgi:Galactose-3-O-sulfotransferase
MSDDPTIIFLHIGKTAGSTMRQVLRRQFSPSQVMVVRSPVRNPRRLRREDTLEHFATLPEPERLRPRLILGHTIFGLHELVPRPCTYITLLRDPIALVVSQYHYVRRTPGHWLYDTAQSMSLEQYIRSGVSLEMDNSQTRALSGDVSTEYGHCTPEMLATATRHIEGHFRLVGMTERFDETLVLLGSAFGWSRLAYVRANVAPGRHRRDVPVETRQLIEAQNELDTDLYAFNVRRFDRTVDETPTFDDRLRRLRRNNAIYRPWGRVTRTFPKRLLTTISTRRAATGDGPASTSP